MAKGNRRTGKDVAADRIQYVPVIIPAGRTPSRAAIEKAVRAATSGKLTKVAASTKLTVSKSTKGSGTAAGGSALARANRSSGKLVVPSNKRSRRKQGSGKPSSEKLDAQLDNYMGDDAKKARLDTELDTYFTQNQELGHEAAEAGEIVSSQN